MFHGFNYKNFFTAAIKGKDGIMMEAMDHILKQEKGKERYLKEVTTLALGFRACGSK